MVGTGSHVRDRMAPAAQRATNTRLAAVCSRDISRARDYATQFNFEKAYDDYSALLADESVDVVYLATPNNLHEQQTVQAAQAGKHVLVEKPMALTSASAESMVEACHRYGVKLGVGYHLRHHQAHIEIRRLMGHGLLGKPRMLQMNWLKFAALRSGWWRDSDQVGAYITMARAVHLVDLVVFLTGQKPVEVTAMTDGQQVGRPLDELAVTLMRLPENVFAILAASRLFPQAESSLVVCGTKGLVLAHGTLSTDLAGSIEVITSQHSGQTTYGDHDPYQAEIESFNRSITENREPNASGTDGLNVVRITEAMLQSVRTHTTVAVRAS